MIALAVVLNFSYAQGQVKTMQKQTDQRENFHHEKQGDYTERQPLNPMMLKMKREFIQENFVIESSQKEAFWNAYNEYEKEIIAAHKEQREFRKENNIPTRMTADSLSNLSDDIILKYYENNFDTKNLLFKAEEKFFNNLKNILKPQQIAQYYILEKNFHKSAVKMDRPGAAKLEMKPMQKDLQVAPMEKKKAN